MALVDEIRKIEDSNSDGVQKNVNKRRFQDIISKMQAKGLVRKQVYNLPTLDEQDRLLFSFGLR